MAKSSFPAKNILFFAILISFIAGGISGSLTGLLAGSYFFQSQSLSGIKEFSGQGETEKYRLVEEDSQVIEMVKRASPSVVSIVISKDLSKYYNATGSNIFPFDDFFEFGFPNNYRFDSPGGIKEVGGGTGFVLDSEKGYILTNKHVVSDEEAEYTVVTNDGNQYQATVVALDPFNDIAIVQIERRDLPQLELGDSDGIEIGQTVIAIGNSLGEYRNTVTKGVVSGINRSVFATGSSGSEIIEEAIQTDAAINPGNSGGPLINIAGQVIGLNTAINRNGESIGFAIPINVARKLIDSVEKHGKFVRPFIGIRYRMIDQKIKSANNLPYDYGALVIRGEKPEDLAVVPGSPADKAGVKENNIILEIDGKRVDRLLGKMVAEYSPGDTVTLKVYQNGEEKELEVTLDKHED